ncbi:MAG: hypothetical protein INH41_16540, partial [Myxococcaceae bacterium]|nr:hypothetical protein [Myxococcaceae bacterium]
MRIVRFVLSVAAVLLASCEWVADPMNFTRDEIPRFMAKVEHPAPPTHPTVPKVMAWNVRYGACRVDFWGDCVQLSSTEVTDCLSKIALLIKAYDPDILLTSESEAGSKRSASVDMIQYNLDNTNLRYATYASTWDARYVPNGQGGQSARPWRRAR